MWLINAETLQLEEHPSYADPSRPRYSVFSHRWGDGEVSFKDMQDEATRSTRAGYQKILKCCEQSLKDAIPYTWIDACCIDKTSTAELSEAINSMYRWYRDAEVCYAYLADSKRDDVSGSAWFSRGWTLQELVAPRSLIFFNHDWQPLGYRRHHAAEIAARTRIPLDLLEGRSTTLSFSIAQRMSWAAERRTTRPEDLAYSLMGIFDVSMPLLYGEGAGRAFQRLQEELIRQYDDHSIFAWSLALDPDNHGLLARSPNAFADSSDIIAVSARNNTSPYAFTNLGVSIKLFTAPYSMNTYFAVLNCERHTHISPERVVRKRVGIFLHCLYENSSFARVSIQNTDILELGILSLSRLGPALRNRKLTVRQAPLNSSRLAFIRPRLYGFRVAENLLGDQVLDRDRIVSWDASVWPAWNTSWDPMTRTIIKAPEISKYTNFADVDLGHLKRKIKRMRLSIDSDFNPVVFLTELSALQDASESTTKTQGIATRSRFEQLNADNIIGWNSISDVLVPRDCDQNIDSDIEQRDQHHKIEYRAHANTSWNEGIWALKGDRITGLDVYLEGLADRRFNEDETWGARLTIMSVETSEGRIWEVDIENLARDM